MCVCVYVCVREGERERGRERAREREREKANAANANRTLVCTIATKTNYLSQLVNYNAVCIPNGLHVGRSNICVCASDVYV